MARTPDRKTLIARTKAAAKRLGKRPPTPAALYRLARISPYQVSRHFENHNELLRTARLPASAASNRRIPDDELMRAMADAFRKAGGLATCFRFDKLCRYSRGPYLRRWKSWAAALVAFRDWQAQNDPKFPYVRELASWRIGGRTLGDQRAIWNSLGARQYGEPLNFRGLLHTPMNEHGVVFLFATLAAELGFLVESLTSGFPDCEAKRRVGKAWERVRIEFEFQSRNFRDHRHDAKACDLIVCWEHNWPNCPIEVLELQAVVDRHMGREQLTMN